MEFNEIVKVFRARINSKEQFSKKGSVCLSTRLLQNIISEYYRRNLNVINKERNIVKKNFINEWMKHLILNTNVYTDAGKFLFKDVVKIIMTDDAPVNVYIDGYDIPFILQYRLSDKFKPLYAKSIRDIELSRIYSLADVLEAKSELLPIMAQITNDVKAYCINNNVNIHSRKFYKDLVAGYDDEKLSSFAKAIPVELGIISNSLRFELMQAGFSSVSKIKVL